MVMVRRGRGREREGERGSGGGVVSGHRWEELGILGSSRTERQGCFQGRRLDRLCLLARYHKTEEEERENTGENHSMKN